jgi:hypothetical protein
MSEERNEKSETQPAASAIDAEAQAAALDLEGGATARAAEKPEGPSLAVAEASQEKPAAKVETLPGAAKSPSAFRGRMLAQAAGFVLALGLGWLGGWASFAKPPAADPAQEAMRQVDWVGLSAGMQKAEASAGRAAAETQALKAGIAAVKETADRSKQEGAARLTQIVERLDRAQRADQDAAAKLAGLLDRVQKMEQQSGARLAEIADRLDKVEHRDPRLAQIAERLERMERQMTAANASSAKTAASDHPAQTGSVPAAKPATVEGWVLRDVYDGVGLVESRNGRLLEIAPGRTLPGVGRVEAIERRGKSWVVVTSRGIITSQQW